MGRCIVGNQRRILWGEWRWKYRSALCVYYWGLSVLVVGERMELE